MEIELSLRCRKRIDGELTLHQREERGRLRSLPTQPNMRYGIEALRIALFLSSDNMNCNASTDLQGAKVNLQRYRHRMCTLRSALRRAMKDADRIRLHGITYTRIWAINVIITTKFTGFSHNTSFLNQSEP